MKRSTSSLLGRKCKISQKESEHAIAKKTCYVSVEREENERGGQGLEIHRGSSERRGDLWEGGGVINADMVAKTLTTRLDGLGEADGVVSEVIHSKVAAEEDIT